MAPPTYRLHRAGGRVKTAGLGLDLLYPAQAAEYAEEPTPEAAQRLRQAFRAIQDAPPFPLMAAFFPQPRSTIKQHLQRAGLYRPMLKTDQGPAGTFLPFTTAADAVLRPVRIVHREGVAIPEAHLAGVLEADPRARELAERVRLQYLHLCHAECARTLDELAQRVGGDRRQAGVGRGLFFFCHPSAPDEPLTVPEALCEKVERAVNEVVERAQAGAALLRARVRAGMPLADALAAGPGDGAAPGDPPEPALYLQADVYLTREGGVHVEQVQLPDLGLFLCEIPSEGYTVLPQVQAVVHRLSEATAGLLGGADGPLYLLTRAAVLDQQEDTLEHLEIRALRRLAEEVGVELRVGAARDAARMPAGARALLLNVDPAGPECEALLARVARGEVHCTPDPFLRLLAGELTTLRRVPVRGRQLRHFLDAIRPGGQMSGKSYHALHRGIERIYRFGEHSADILHVEVPGERSVVPTLRHSVHSFTSLYNTCKRNGFPDLHIREVPVGRDDLLVHSDTGPHLSAFRFFFTRA